MGLISLRGGDCMKCGECGNELKERIENEQGIKMRVFWCPRCGKELMELKEVMRVQRRLQQRIEETRPVVRVGNSIGITFPAKIKDRIKIGDKVHMVWDMETKKAELSVE